MDPAPVDVQLVNAIHRGWFERAFPNDAGQHRTVVVANRQDTAAPVEAILPGVHAACENWAWRWKHHAPDDDGDLVAFTVAEATSLAVAVYDTHPFIDGNTRAAWHLRNYVLMLGGLLPLRDLIDEAAHDAAWWAASAQDHEELDLCVLRELDASDR